MTDNVSSMPVSVRKQAELEIAEENSKKAVKLMKAKLEQLQKAELVVKNILREIEDPQVQIDQGDIPA